MFVFLCLTYSLSMLLLLLSRVSRVRLWATPEMAAQQAPPFLGFSWQEHWGGLSHPWDSPGKNTSGLSLPSPMHKSESEVTQLCLTLSDPMNYSLPGSSAHGIFQARVLEWGAIASCKELTHWKRLMVGGIGGRRRR